MADTPPVGTTAADKSARATLASVLQTYGLPASLVDTIWDQQYIAQSKGIDQIILDLPNTPQFQQRFPKYKEIQAAHPGFSVTNYMDFENQMKATNQRYGIPSGFYDTPDDIANFLVRGVSTNEYEDRVKMGVAAAVQSPPELRSELNRMYGVDLGHLTAYFLDPTKAEPELQKQVAAASVGATAVRARFGLLSQDEAERLAQLGLTDNQTQQGFDQLAQQKELMGALPGETGAGTISRQAQLGAAFEGDAEAQQAIDTRARTRKAAAQGGGDFAGSSKGLTGLGEAV